METKTNKNWVIKGDSNSKFFHLYANGRRRKNFITFLETDHGEVTDQQDIMNHVISFYKQLFGPNQDCSMRLSHAFWSSGVMLTEAEIFELDKPFKLEEVKEAIMSMKRDSAPGPNGFSVTFFQQLWEVVKDDYFKMFEDFHRGYLDIKRLNYGVITLVPKTQQANNIKQYRPICLLNVDFKGFTKFLTNRLSKVADKIIGSNQIGFIKGRNILEGVVVLHEVIHELRRTKQGVIVKIDFEKACVRWTFLENVMRGKGFSNKWIQMVMATVQRGKVCVNVNG